MCMAQKQLQLSTCSAPQRKQLWRNSRTWQANATTVQHEISEMECCDYTEVMNSPSQLMEESGPSGTPNLVTCIQCPEQDVSDELC